MHGHILLEWYLQPMLIPFAHLVAIDATTEVDKVSPS